MCFISVSHFFFFYRIFVFLFRLHFLIFFCVVFFYILLCTLSIKFDIAWSIGAIRDHTYNYFTIKYKGQILSSTTVCFQFQLKYFWLYLFIFFYYSVCFCLSYVSIVRDSTSLLMQIYYGHIFYSLHNKHAYNDIYNVYTYNLLKWLNISTFSFFSY